MRRKAICWNFSKNVRAAGIVVCVFTLLRSGPEMERLYGAGRHARLASNVLLRCRAVVAKDSKKRGEAVAKIVNMVFGNKGL